jgi:hypothetical protein
MCWTGLGLAWLCVRASRVAGRGLVSVVWLCAAILGSSMPRLSLTSLSPTLARLGASCFFFPFCFSVSVFSFISALHHSKLSHGEKAKFQTLSLSYSKAKLYARCKGVQRRCPIQKEHYWGRHPCPLPYPAPALPLTASGADLIRKGVQVARAKLCKVQNNKLRGHGHGEGMAVCTDIFQFVTARFIIDGPCHPTCTRRTFKLSHS